MKLRLALMVGAVVLIAAAMWEAPSAVVEPELAHGPEQAAAVSPARFASSARAPTSAVVPRFSPGSLADTAVDGELVVDEHGDLVVSDGLRRFFDYHLSARGEVSDGAIDAAVRAAINERLPPQAAARGGLLWDRYQRYREAGLELQGELEKKDLGARLEKVSELRRAIFGDADAEALFGHEEQMQRVDLARMQVRANDSLTSEEKAEAEAALRDELPAEEREAREASGVLDRLDTAESTATDAAALHAARVAVVGEEAAARLAELDGAREVWQARVEALRAELDGVGSQDVQALLDRSFDEREQIRVRTLLGLAQ